MKATEITQWQCVGCDKWHNSPDAADECCTDKMETRTVCSICEEELSWYPALQKSNARHLASHDNDDEVEPDTDNFGLPVKTQAELEEAGQERLFANHD